jgi:hypothetical protein
MTHEDPSPARTRGTSTGHGLIRVPRRHVRDADRPVLRTEAGIEVYGPTRDEARIVEDVLREAGALRSLAWVERAPRIPGHRLFVRVTGDLEVIVTGAYFARDTDRFWLHVSAVAISTTYPPQSLLPTWDQLREVKSLFIGDGRTGIQILPPLAHHVNCHPHALHVWCCLTEDVTPDFRGEGGLI